MKKMDYILLHKNYPVFFVKVNEEYKFEKIGEIVNRERIPPGLDKRGISKADLNYWFFDRGIPAKRKELPDILDKTNRKTREELIIKNLGLGLADRYWIKKEDDTRTWEQMNFFENNFTQEFGEMYIGEESNALKKRSKEEFLTEEFLTEEVLMEEFLTPNSVSSGNLPKMWIKEKNKLYMIKGSELNIIQEPFNEKIISDYLQTLGINHVVYDVIQHNNKPYSKCENMLGKDEELIHAYYVAQVQKRDNKNSWLDHYIACCRKLDLKEDIRKDLDEMILVDYMSANIDRHWSNFGIIRDSETLQAKRLAPLYDHGASLFAKYATKHITEVNKNLESRSFCAKQGDNMRLVSNLDLLENKEIYSLCDLIKGGFDKDYVDDKRINEIGVNIKARIDSAVKRLQGSRDGIDYGRSSKVEKENVVKKGRKA